VAIIAALVVGVVGCTTNDDNEPGGRIVVFASPDVMLIPPTGEFGERFGLGVGDFWDAAFSADGNRVAFNPARGIESGGITLRTLGEESSTRIRNQPSEHEFLSWGFVWAPDGKSIAFVHGAKVFTIGTDGRDLHELGIGSDPSWTAHSR
jgi:hypothetical protein